MAAPSILGKTQKFLGNTVGSAAGFAAGLAVSPALAPEIQDLVNEAWQLHPSRVPDAGTLATGVAQGQVDPNLAQTWAEYHGYNPQRFGALIDIANTGPGVAQAFRLWRRDLIDDGGFSRALKRAAIEDEWIKALRQTRNEPLDPADIARGIHRGLVPDPGLVLGVPSPGPGKVQAYPVYNIDALREASWFGLDHDHLGVLVGLQGLPMGSHEAAQALFRGVIEDNDYLRAIAEGNTRNEWADAIREQSRQIPTAHEYVENTLRGYSDQAAMQAGAARHGMTSADVALLFQNAGRPLAIHQITTGLARGGSFKPIPGELTDPYEAASHESNLKPAYYDLNIANKYTMPSVLAIRGLAQSGAWDFDTTHTRLLWSGWYPPDAEAVARFWTQKTATGLSPAIKSAQTRFITAIHKAYVGGSITDAQLTEQLALSLLDAADQAGVAEFYRKEKALEAIPPPPAA